jgi:ribosome-associated protein
MTKNIMDKIVLQPTNLPERILIEIARLPILLGQFLKHVGIAQNGLEAKIKIQNGEISVNGQLELRRGRQLYDGDQIGVGCSLYVIKLIQ